MTKPTMEHSSLTEQRREAQRQITFTQHDLIPSLPRNLTVPATPRIYPVQSAHRLAEYITAIMDQEKLARMQASVRIG